MNKIEAITSFTRNSAKYGISVKEAAILVAVAQVCAHKQKAGLPAMATQTEINLVTGMEMRSTITRLNFWIEFKRVRTGKLHYSHYWLNQKGLDAVANLLDLSNISIDQVVKEASIRK
jgi:hypothetical protein